MAGEALKVRRGSVSQRQGGEAVRVRAGFLTAQHFSRGWASPRNPVPSETTQKPARHARVHHALKIPPQLSWWKTKGWKAAPQPGCWAFETILWKADPGADTEGLSGLGWISEHHINTCRYAAPPHAASRYLLITFRWLLTSLLGPDCGCWILRNLALSYFRLAPQSTAGRTNLSACGHFVPHKRGQIPTDPREPQARKRKDLPALMHYFWFILSLCWVEPLISAEWSLCEGGLKDLERNQQT